MPINVEALRLIKQRLREKVTEQEIKAEIKQLFPEINDDQVADSYIGVAKLDAPRLRHFDKLAALRVTADIIQLRAYCRDDGHVYVRNLDAAEFQTELRDFRDQYQISLIMETLKQEPAHDADLLPPGKVDLHVVRGLGLVAD